MEALHGFMGDLRVRGLEWNRETPELSMDRVKSRSIDIGGIWKSRR